MSNLKVNIYLNRFYNFGYDIIIAPFLAHIGSERSRRCEWRLNGLIEFNKKHFHCKNIRAMVHLVSKYIDHIILSI